MKTAVDLDALGRERDALRAQLAEKDARIKELEQKYNAVVVSENEHCKDCCCAKSWKALGITQYTGKSIPEHIDALRTQLADAVETLKAIARRADSTEVHYWAKDRLAKLGVDV